MKRVLTIAGSDSGGGAGIQADLKTIASMGCHGMSVITALTAQNRRGIQSVHPIPLTFIEAQMDAIFSDTGADAVKTGMLCNGKVVKLIAEKISQYGVSRLVVDPIIAASNGTSLLDKEGQDALRSELLPPATLVTPNLPEATALSGIEVRSVDSMKEAACRIHSFGVQAVLVKGGHLDGDPVDILLDGSELTEFRTNRVGIEDVHGTGCVLSAAIATGLAEGLSLKEAVQQAREINLASIARALTPEAIGKSSIFPTDYGTFSEERSKIIEALQEAIIALHNETNIGRLIPEVSSNLGYALPSARSEKDVAAFPGRILRLDDTIATLDAPAFGASRHIASIILTAMKYNPTIRSAMNVRFSHSILRSCQYLGLQARGFNRAQEPQEVAEEEGHSLAWGVEKVLAEEKDIPDVVYDEGGWGKEPMIRILGRDPGEVVQKVIRVCRRHSDGDTTQ